MSDWRIQRSRFFHRESGIRNPPEERMVRKGECMSHSPAHHKNPFEHPVGVFTWVLYRPFAIALRNQERLGNLCFCGRQCLSHSFQITSLAYLVVSCWNDYFILDGLEIYFGERNSCGELLLVSPVWQWRADGPTRCRSVWPMVCCHRQPNIDLQHYLERKRAGNM